MIRLLDKDHEILQPDYVNAQALPKKEIELDENLRAYKDAFTGLPKPPRSQQKKRAIVGSKINKEKKPSKLAQMQYQILQM